MKIFWVFNPDLEVKKRYEDIKGQGIENFEFIPLKFEESYFKIKEAFNFDL